MNRINKGINSIDRLVKFAQSKGFRVKLMDLNVEGGCGYLWGDKILVNNNPRVSEDRVLYTLAHEIAHGYLHYDKGNTINSYKHSEYEEEADRGARLILDLLTMDSRLGCNS